MNIKITLCLIAIMGMIVGVQAQNNTSLSGRVKDGIGAIAGALIRLQEHTVGATTDLDGFYELKPVQPGKYILVVSGPGYQSESRTVVLKPQEQLVMDFLLQENRQTLEHVTVTEKTGARRLKESGFSVNAIETKELANTTADLNQVLNRSAGIRIREQGGVGSAFSFSINGLSGKAVKYFLDGVPLELMGSNMSLNNIPVNLAERIEVYKGVVPVQLGSDAMGGAVNVITNQKISNYLDASHSFGSFNTHRSALSAQYIHKKTGIVLRASGFYNYSDNNYLMKGVEVLEGGTRRADEITDLAGATFKVTDATRFHDGYQSFMGQLEAGVSGKKWADLLFVGVGYTSGFQDLQTGFEQTIVYGKVSRESEAMNGSIRYKKDNLFLKGLNANFFASYAKDAYRTIDTFSRQYYWDGSWTAKGATEMGSVKTLAHIVRPRGFARANLSYVFNDRHSFNINYTIDYLKNESFNKLIEDRDHMPGLMNKQILGMAYQQEFLDRRLTNTFFAKYYHLGLERKIWKNGAYEAAGTTFGNYGYGIASRYKLRPDLGIKISLEHAYRLQEVEEMFGDGLNVQPNPDLKPERSDNINLGTYYGFQFRKHKIFLEAGAFYRNARDFIYPVPDQRSKALKNENKASVRVAGWEGEFRYDYANLISFSINATYQNAINTTKFGSTGSVNYEATYLNKIPNQPWFFGNAGLSIGKNDFLARDTRVQLNWFTQYVHWFYLTWEAFGNVNGKSDIPDQLLHTVSLSYSFKKGRYNVSAECRNLTNNLSYDNFRLQKPGRSFALKLRYFLK